MQSTQRVEGQNGIIKHLVNSNTSLINLVKHIDEQIDRASTFVQYKNWIHSTTGATLIHASSEFSPDIDKWITAYLIPTSLSMQWQEIAQAIWYTQLDITEQSDSIESLNTFIKDSVDAPPILAKKLISSLEIESVLEIWEVTQHRRKAKNYIILFKNNSHLCTCLGLTKNGFVCKHFFQVMTVSSYAAFHIMMISKWWYTNEKQLESELQTRQQPFIIGVNNN
ncbi:hypothetical protein C2G38_2312652, partial [Gigaspora rosea]